MKLKINFLYFDRQLNLQLYPLLAHGFSTIGTTINTLNELASLYSTWNGETDGNIFLVALEI